ncbi:MAG: exo-alpha-sialidase [Actinomycetota bacterium]|nr:exo-alpha-sialidase [Actinomycetota bacterium]
MNGGRSPKAHWTSVGRLVAAIAVAAGAVACASGGGGSASSAGNSVQLAHVHGLGVDPGTGELYAGSHYGLIRFPQRGEPGRVGGLVQDFMGFAVVGPNHFLASGHPGAGQGGPSKVGLIESTDGGRSWRTLSLAGQADFHTLKASHGLVFGSNAGQLMVSKDGRAWETRARIAMADLAINPKDAEMLLATTQQGLARSTDGGQNFGLVAGAPLLQLLTWTDTGDLVGITPEGTVQVSSDGGTTWSQRGSAGGAPEALTASGNQIYAAVEGKIVSSDDGGSTFKTRYEGS